MLVLGIDTSSIVATAAVIENNKVVCEYTLNHKKTHSQKLMPIIKNILEACEITINQIDVIGVAIGPGSFTGLRIGVSTAKALAHSLNKPIVGICTLDALAFGACHFHGLICPILDAKRDQVYTAVYKWEEQEAKLVSEYMAVSIHELLDIVSKYNEDAVFLGDGVYPFKEVITSNLGTRAKFMPGHSIMQRASLVAELALKKYTKYGADDYLTLNPFYLRKSQAERMKEVGLS